MTALARPIETETEAEDAGVAAFAEHLLRLIAEDPLVRGTHRAAARRHLARLAPPRPRRPVMDEAEEDAGEAEG